MCRKLLSLAIILALANVTILLIKHEVGYSQPPMDIGVKVGDWALYDLTAVYETNDPTPPFNFTSEPPEWVKGTIISVIDRNVTIEQHVHFTNGTSINFSLWIEFETENETSSLVWRAIGMELLKPANLTAGDKVWYPDMFYGRLVVANINETISSNKFGMLREINHLNITRDMRHDGYHTFGSMNFYWDKLTGIPLYVTYWMKEVNIDYGYITEGSIICEIVDTNLWNIPPKAYLFIVRWQNSNFTLTAITNSTITNFTFDPAQKEIKFNITGLSATSGYCNISIPKTFMWCNLLSQWSVTVDGLPPNKLEVSENATHSFIYFTYTHSTHEVIITATNLIPEYPTMFLSLIMFLFTCAVIMTTRKSPKRK